LSIKVKIEKTSDRKFEEIKEFANLEDAIKYCYDLKEKEVGIWEYKVIVKNSGKGI
jgi:predicted transcriptional regulator